MAQQGTRIYICVCECVCGLWAAEKDQYCDGLGLDVGAHRIDLALCILGSTNR
jgi:hypothetical protein